MSTEQQLHHGAPVHSKLRHKIRRFLRSDLGAAPTPYDWNTPLDVPIYNIKNQFQSESCWGQAFSRAMQIILGSEELSAKSAYSTIYEQGGGVNLWVGEKEARYFGITTELKVPSYHNGTTDEPFMTDIKWQTDANLKDCFTRMGYKAVNVPMDIDSIAQAIATNKAVLFLIHGSNNGTWLSPIPQPPKAGDNIWGHYVTSCKPMLINGKKMIRFYQSWGSQVGENGFQYLSEEYVNSGYVLDAVTFIKVKK